MSQFQHGVKIDVIIFFIKDWVLVVLENENEAFAVDQQTNNLKNSPELL